MPLIKYTNIKFKPATLELIGHVNDIVATFVTQGYGNTMTLRQVYYQLVALDLFPDDRTWRQVPGTNRWVRDPNGTKNAEPNYDWLGKVISDGRRCGLIDWARFIDRTRNIRHPSQWDGPEELVSACADQFDIDWWADQKYRVLVLIEKDALMGILETACAPWHCPYSSCRGYSSDSELWNLAQQVLQWRAQGKKGIIIHLGDHDPSGVDASRDIRTRLSLFAGYAVDVRRLALTMAQVEQFNPPPNPAKTTDARFRGYQEEFGDESWELDALTPPTIGQIIATEMAMLIDQAAWQEAEQRRDDGRRLLRALADDWDNITENL